VRGGDRDRRPDRRPGLRGRRPPGPRGDLAFLGDLDAGVEELGQARRIAETVGRVDEVARAFANLSGLLEAFGRLEEATEVALEGAELAAGQGLGR